MQQSFIISNSSLADLFKPTGANRVDSFTPVSDDVREYSVARVVRARY